MSAQSLNDDGSSFRKLQSGLLWQSAELEFVLIGVLIEVGDRREVTR